ncbi:helix-turn-helix domain-containing protein [Salinicola acroporae]|uniref:helix-turn-helix domain-containing protein n=1 Tax=Salinicola acroporae TaxID=1541440 RepID=UPI001F0BB961|nr:helix-turn-helix domain-containing protein [Salinicola acroporae]
MPAWRQRARLLRSLELLASVETVQSTALTRGYTSISAFIARSHEVFGCTPGRYAAGEPVQASFTTPTGKAGSAIDADQ